MKDCKNCDYFEGYDYSDGMPHCDYDGGYEKCPYNDYANIKNNGIKIEIDTEFMSDYIRHTLKNTIENETFKIAKQEVQTLITEDLKERVNDEIKRQTSDMVTKELEIFMSKEITIGGGWSEPKRTLTRNEYLAESVEKELNKHFKSNEIIKRAENAAKQAINNFNIKLRDNINKNIQTYFNEATKQILTENVVTMLMSNDTYKRLSESMQTFLPEK